MIYFCCSDLRAELIQGNPNYNGIDFVEVLDDPSTPPDQAQRTLFVHFVNPLSVPVTSVYVRVEGGERIRDIKVQHVDATEDNNVISVRVDRAGDFSTYRLVVVVDPNDPADNPPPWMDPVLASVEFSFKAGCDTHVDCLPIAPCPPEAVDVPVIDYLAKDYSSFRQVMRDRMSVVVPSWTEQNPADVGVMLTEVLAHVGDQLSYEQDAVATEAYLGTAVRRASVRRHARLVDYYMHDGSNSRVWVQIEVDSDLPSQVFAKDTKLFTAVAGFNPGRVAPDPLKWPQVIKAQATVFELMQDADHLLKDLNRMSFYTWGDQECCLPSGATAATLLNHHPGLALGDVLLFQEVLDPQILKASNQQPAQREGLAALNADPRRRAAVRLTSVSLDQDPVTSTPITQIGWGPEDALPFAITVGTTVDGKSYEVAVALGNIVLADQGLTIDREEIGSRAEASLIAEPGSGPCAPPMTVPVDARFNPRLVRQPITQAGPKWKASDSAAAVFRRKAQDMLPEIRVNGPEGKDSIAWTPQHDLIKSKVTSPDFVAEIDNDGYATLRFGDGVRFGKGPPAGQYWARYRVGNGSAGNVGWNSIVHIWSPNTDITSVSNPMPARGGVDPEASERVRQRAPYAFQLEQERAVTPNDYARFATQYPDANAPDVLQAQGRFRWTGSWYTVFVTTDRKGGKPVDDPFRQALRDYLEQYRMAGHDLEVEDPVLVPLELDMTVCVDQDHFRNDVQQALLAIFTSGVLPDGRLGLFHPDRFTFGQVVYLSPFVAAAQAIDGVQSVHVSKFQRWGLDSNDALDAGKLELHPLEIARLDANPSFPDRGVFELKVEGGK